MPNVWGTLTSKVPAPKPGTPLWRALNGVGTLNVKLFRWTGGRVGGSFDGAPLLVLHHKGAKSGTWRETPVIHLADGDRYVIVASIGGNPHNPAWYHNLRANPDVEVEVRGGRRAVRARQASREEADALWPRLEAMWPAWREYKARTEREFPVMLLEPR